MPIDTTTIATPPASGHTVAPPVEGLSLLDAALAYAARGIPVFPCNEQKRPLTPRGFKDATTDPKQIRAWWSRWPRAGIGMPTGLKSGFWVVDVDMPEGPGTLAALEAEHGPLPKTLSARTGGGGRHIFFKWDPAAPIRNNAKTKLGPGLDIRGDGGYVILAPSPHESGNAYRWEKETPDAPARRAQTKGCEER